MKTALLRALIIVVTWPLLAIVHVIGWLLGAFIVVPLALAFKVDMTKLPIWGNPKGLDWWPHATDRIWIKRNAYWWYAIRNPMAKAHELFTQPSETTTYGDPGNLEDKEGFQWQYRFAGLMDEFRVTFGKPDIKKGKDEVLIGWKYGDQAVQKGISWTIQMRPAWLAVFPLALLIWGVWRLIVWW